MMRDIDALNEEMVAVGAGRIVVGLPRDAQVSALNVYGRGPGDANWEPIARAADDRILITEAGRIEIRMGVARAAPIDQLKVEIVFQGRSTAVPITRIAVLSMRAH